MGNTQTTASTPAPNALTRIRAALRCEGEFEDLAFSSSSEQISKALEITEEALGTPAVAPLHGRELATVLAALRFYSRRKLSSGTPFLEDAIASDDGRLVPLDRVEIDALCERLNAATPTPSPSTCEAELLAQLIRMRGWLQGLAETQSTLSTQIDKTIAKAQGR